MSDVNTITETLKNIAINILDLIGTMLDYFQHIV